MAKRCMFLQFCKLDFELYVLKQNKTHYFLSLPEKRNKYMSGTNPI